MRNFVFLSSLLLLLTLSQADCSSIVGNKLQAAKPAPWFTVDLDQQPIDRWQHVAKHYNGSLISQWIDETVSSLVPEPGLVKMFMKLLIANLDNYFTEEMADEMKGLSKALDIELYEVVLINIIYDFSAFNSTYSKACTSIVAEDAEGNIYHGRNLDYYGPDVMKYLTVQVDFHKNGTSLFKGTTFVGYVGIITGVKAGAFSISGDERDTGYLVDNLFSALLGGRLDFWHQRKVLETARNYDEAVQQLSTAQVIAPVYYIVGGVRPGEGAIIVRDPDTTVGTVHMRNQTDHTWFVLETNYDPWDAPPADDDRRYPGIKAMNKMGQANLKPSTLYEVLSTFPVMNDETVYSTVMSPTNGKIYHTMIRYDAPPPPKTVSTHDTI